VPVELWVCKFNFIQARMLEIHCTRVVQGRYTGFDSKINLLSSYKRICSNISVL
jgi:hypothetical protein